MRRWIEPEHRELSIARQCALLGLARSTRYYRGAGESAENLLLMRSIDEQYLRYPFYGSRKFSELLGVNRKRIQRLMRRMGIEAIYPKRRTTWPGAGHQVYPYLLLFRHGGGRPGDTGLATQASEELAATRLTIACADKRTVLPPYLRTFSRPWPKCGRTIDTQTGL